MKAMEVQGVNKIQNKFVEVILMVLVLSIPVVVYQVLQRCFYEIDYSIYVMILSFSNCISIGVLVYWTSTAHGKSIIPQVKVEPLKLSDIIIGIGYFLLTLSIVILFTYTIFIPLGLLNSGHISPDYSDQSQSVFAFQIIHTITWIIFEELFFRKYLLYRFQKVFTSPIFLGITLISVDVLYQLIFYPDDFDGFFVFVSIFSVISYMRGRKLIRPIISNFLSTILVYMLSSGLLNKILHLN